MNRLPEKEERVRNKKVHLIFSFNDGSKGIHTVAKIGVSAYDIDSGE